jgi:hypothetical protein
VHDILHDQMTSPALLAWLFGERYGFGSPWRVTRKCLPGGIYGRGEPLPEGATGSAGVGCQGIRPSCRARAAASVRLAAPSYGRGYHRKIPLPCHLRVTPSPCVRSYRPQMKETLSAGRTGMAAPRPARAQQGNCRSLPRAQSAPPGMTRSAAAARRWLELA